LPQISRDNKGKTLKVTAVIQGEIQAKTRRKIAQFLSLYFTNCFELSRDYWPRSVKSHS